MTMTNTMTKTEVREWIRRIRADLREAEALLTQPGPLADVWDAMEPFLRDASGSAEQIISNYEEANHA